MESLKERFERSCRLCAEEQDVTIQMFSPDSKTIALLQKLKKYLLFKIDEDDILPKTVCVKCCPKLQTVCDFIETARKAQDVLFARSVALEKVRESDHCLFSEIQVKTEPIEEDDDTITQMEINVDPQMVFQNCESDLSPKIESTNTEDVRFLQCGDGENVTIKLIKQAENKPEPPQIIVIENKPVPAKTVVGLKPFACTLCQRSFLTELALKGHIWIHLREGTRERSFKCPNPKCFQLFNQRIDFIKHLRDHRGKNTCKICARMSEGNLKIHMESHKTPSNAHICKICGRSYDKISNLKTHSITHSNERPFKCHICKKCFKRNQDLKFHINQHTGAKPYKCPFCDKCFASSGNCYSHRNRMHPGRMIDTKSARCMRRVINLAREGEEPLGKTIIVRTAVARRRKQQ